MACDSLTGLCITVGQALGLCSEIVPTGKPSAYSLRFALGNNFTTQPFGLTHS